jgi:phage recombination protein Bet
MSKEIMKTSTDTVIKTDSGDIKLSPKIIKQYLVRGNGSVTDQETMMFLSLCKFQKLNPFLNEAYLVKFGTSPANIIVGKEVFTKRAFNHPNFNGLSAGIIVEREGQIVELEGSFKNKNDILLGGWAVVHVKGLEVPFKTSVSLDEYDKKQSTWKQIPCTMIRKVALVQALREAFPEYFQAMYSEEEMPVDNELINNFDKIETPDESKVEEEVVEIKEVNPIIEEEFEKHTQEIIKDLKNDTKDLF